MNEIILKKLDAGDIVCSNGLERGVKVEATGAATVTVTKADNANRITVIEAIATGSGADNYVLPVPTDVGEEYTFIWGGRAADADNIIFRSESADGLTFSGGLLDIDEDDTNDATDINCVYPGSDDDKLTLTNPTGFNITFVCTSVGSTPNYAVMGWAASTNTSAAFGDQ
jgi:hypothetical protein|tara:strand:- start:399 stop:908 length:510 start_codon:yes stop_codon:yes gene_type:complete